MSYKEKIFLGLLFGISFANWYLIYQGSDGALLRQELRIRILELRGELDKCQLENKK